MSSVLSPDDLAAFEAEGYVRVRQAFSRDAALRMQEWMWQELREELGILRDDPGTWRQPIRDLRRARSDPGQAALAEGSLVGAIDDLIGAGSWSLPAHWGRVLVTFPDRARGEWTVPTDTWHWDCELGENLCGLRRLLIFTFFSDVEPRGGGTLIVKGSHRLLRRFHEGLTPAEQALRHRSLRKRFLRWDPWLARLAGLDPGPPDRVAYFMDAERRVRDVPVRVVELTGQPGDTVLCHPLMVHTPAPNASRWPRFMRAKNFVQSTAPSS